MRTARFRRSLVALAVLVLFLGLHWAMLQAVAWTRMVIVYSQDAPLVEALAKTFDGRHPCRLCLAVREGRDQERKQTPTPSELQARWDCEVPEASAVLRPPARTAADFHRVDWLPARFEAPPKPRPRCSVAA